MLSCGWPMAARAAFSSAAASPAPMPSRVLRPCSLVLAPKRVASSSASAPSAGSSAVASAPAGSAAAASPPSSGLPAGSLRAGLCSGKAMPAAVASARRRFTSVAEAPCCLRIAFILRSCSCRLRASLPLLACCCSASCCLSASSSALAPSTFSRSRASATRTACCEAYWGRTACQAAISALLRACCASYTFHQSSSSRAEKSIEAFTLALHHDVHGLLPKVERVDRLELSRSSSGRRTRPASSSRAPPNAFDSSRVSFDSRKGGLPLWAPRRAPRTQRPSVVSDWLMALASSKAAPSTPDFLTRSEPARSTR